MLTDELTTVPLMQVNTIARSTWWRIRRTVADRRSRSGGYDRSDTRNIHQPLTGFVFARHPADYCVGFIDLALQLPHPEDARNGRTRSAPSALTN